MLMAEEYMESNAKKCITAFHLSLVQRAPSMMRFKRFGDFWLCHPVRHRQHKERSSESLAE